MAAASMAEAEAVTEAVAAEETMVEEAMRMVGRVAAMASASATPALVGMAVKVAPVE